MRIIEVCDVRVTYSRALRERETIMLDDPSTACIFARPFWIHRALAANLERVNIYGATVSSDLGSSAKPSGAPASLPRRVSCIFG